MTTEKKRNPIGFKNNEPPPEEEFEIRDDIDEALDILCPNLYLHAISKAFHEFLLEEANGEGFTEKRLSKKIDAARLLFPDFRNRLKSALIEQEII